ncbi:MAG: 3'(2'),5'-bisphosphate nucleotidase CysQ [Xanthomonadales bacterium]|nr:3'(2'),5'-bisphosphate nucleotidase CysQ [Xanthomonadales bacterium]
MQRGPNPGRAVHRSRVPGRPLAAAGVVTGAWVDDVCALARRAGEAIMAVYATDFEIAQKDDASPLTRADLAAHEILVSGLAALPPGLPVLSEESASTVPAVERRHWRRYWLVDPLDGTREFIKRNDEFTVNIALVEDGVPVVGVVFAPALDEMAWACSGQGAWHVHAGRRQRLAGRPAPATPVVAVSRSHLDAHTARLLAGMGAHETLAAGSALKFIRMAQGRADLYPRLGPTSEWDTAAGHCLLTETGGEVFALDGRPLRYNRRAGLLNPSFLAVADSCVDWPARLAGLLPPALEPSP